MIRGEFRVALAFWVALAVASTPCGARDLSLTDAEGLLAAHNRELRAARRTVESAEAQRLIAGARPNPTFSINSSEINRNPGIGGGPLGQKHIDTVFRIDQPFERGDKRELRLDVASGLQKAAENDSLDVLRQQLAALRAAYFDLKQVQEKVVVLADTAQLFTGTLAAAQARLKAGDLAPADVAKVQVDYERAQNEARAVRAELVRAQFALGYMIGAEASAGELRATDPWPRSSRQSSRAPMCWPRRPESRRRRSSAISPRPSVAGTSPSALNTSTFQAAFPSTRSASASRSRCSPVTIFRATSRRLRSTAMPRSTLWSARAPSLASSCAAPRAT
ncbi:MAG: TolC family protein [Betaproteobacteria bacterium]|nr:MAG: TolC family protein [Betaproteobacteria bacterium]